MYLVIQNNRVVETFNTSEGAHAYANHTQIVMHTTRKNAKKGDRVSKFRK